MLDLGYAKLSLKSSWIAKFDVESDQVTLHSRFGSATATLVLLSAGESQPEDKVSELYESWIKRYQSLGKHLNDLAEDFDYELIVEVNGGENEPEMKHIFLRLCSNVILCAELINHSPVDEDELRQMLSVLCPGDHSNSNPAFTKLTPSLELENWNRLGNVRYLMGSE